MYYNMATDLRHNVSMLQVSWSLWFLRRVFFAKFTSNKAFVAYNQCFYNHIIKLSYLLYWVVCLGCFSRLIWNSSLHERIHAGDLVPWLACDVTGRMDIRACSYRDRYFH